MGFFDDLFSTTVKQINEWSPDGCSNEKEYENSLYKYLHSVFPDTQITKQYAVGRAKADIGVGNPVEVIIEIKKDLNATNKMQRLMGQIDEYQNWKGRIIILLVGQTEPNIKKQIIARAKSSKEVAFFERQLVILTK
jgi:hypothetical protein